MLQYARNSAFVGFVVEGCSPLYTIIATKGGTSYSGRIRPHSSARGHAKASFTPVRYQLFL